MEVGRTDLDRLRMTLTLLKRLYYSSMESRFLATDSPSLQYERENVNSFGFEPDAGFKEVQADAETVHVESPQQSRTLYRENKFPSSNSLCEHVLVKSCKSSKRAASVDFMEYVVPYEDEKTHAQLNCKRGSKSFWKTLRFWQRNKISVACMNLNSSPRPTDFKLEGHGHKLTRAKREVLGPVYTTCSSAYSSNPRTSDQQVSYPAILPPLTSGSGGNGCPYIPLNRCQRIPSGPLYFP
uniref:Uncharacterized protein n=2 Tax=Physcomitrium patens TaxID=3218 RepID=A0A7I4F723_PHYPA